MISEKFMKKLLVEQCQKISIQQLKVSVCSDVALLINNQSVGIALSKCNYGGQRMWFLCPNCGKRSGVLYCRPLQEIFLCRSCNQLTYQLSKYHRSTQESFIRAIKSAKVGDV